MNDHQFYYIIDALAPFILPKSIRVGQVINWSKIPFFLLEKNGTIPDIQSKQIENRFETYINKVSSIGYNSISIDDLAHLSILQSYPSSIKEKIDHYRILFHKLFIIAQSHKLNIFINTDAAFAPEGVSLSTTEAIDSVVMLCRDLFITFPCVSGIILRLGECDGVDVHGELKSNLVFQKSKHVRDLVTELVKLFTYYNRTLIVRTWTVGAYEIGDLMWNPSTYKKIFGGICSENLLVSHKYGDTDFFRYLQLNPLIYYGEQKKIVEFQARREYEGFGEFPSFVGYEYEKYRDKLIDYEMLSGIHVWCQTGGWSRFHKVTYMPGSSIWNEINTEITVKLFEKKVSITSLICDISKQKFPQKNPEYLQQLLQISDDVIKKLWYLPEFSSKSIYFRGLRIPPLVWIFWDTIIVSPMLRRFINLFVKENDFAIKDGFKILNKIDELKKIAINLGIDKSDFDFQYDTFEILAKVRQYYLGDESIEIVNDLLESIEQYTKKHPNGFGINGNLTKEFAQKRIINIIMLCILRNKSKYRPFEKTVFQIGLFLVRPIIRIWGKSKFPQIANERAMGIEALLK